MNDRPAHSLSSLEIACGLVLGLHAPLDAASAGGLTPLEALERAILPALERAPCLVSFSGGRDSSAVLAVATRLARREGLPLPIPATNRFAIAGHEEEKLWQQEVIRHLGLADWFRNEVEDELDCVGPVAQETLRRHGLLWPFNAHFIVPLLRAASGGSLLTGIGGDEALGASRWTRAAAVASLRVRPRPRDVLKLGLALAPRRLRVPVVRRRLDVGFPWLRPASERIVLDEWARESASEPFRWEARCRWWRSLRYVQVCLRTLEVLSSAEGVRVVSPFAEPAFADALARLPRESRFQTRTDAMRFLFGDVLPEAVLARVGKASFDEAFFNRHSRLLVSGWGGEGADLAHVDPDGLRRTWSAPDPDPRSFLLLQAAFLASDAS